MPKDSSKIEEFIEKAFQETAEMKVEKLNEGSGTENPKYRADVTVHYTGKL